MLNARRHERPMHAGQQAHSGLQQWASGATAGTVGTAQRAQTRATAQVTEATAATGLELAAMTSRTRRQLQAGQLGRPGSSLRTGEHGQASMRLQMRLGTWVSLGTWEYGKEDPGEGARQGSAVNRERRLQGRKHSGRTSGRGRGTEGGGEGGREGMAGAVSRPGAQGGQVLRPVWQQGTYVVRIMQSVSCNQGGAVARIVSYSVSYTRIRTPVRTCNPDPPTLRTPAASHAPNVAWNVSTASM